MNSLFITLTFCLLDIALLEAQGTVDNTFIDIDGNIYKTVTIGRYEWMAENLGTATYMDSLKIPYVASDSIWTNLSYGAYCWYDNDSENAELYGALYNWYAVNTCRLCPAGWHIPTDEEWKYLESYVDTCVPSGDSVGNNFRANKNIAGKWLKAKSNWESGGDGTDDFNSSASPGGERISRNGHFLLIGRNGFWWSGTQDGRSKAIFRRIIYSLPDISRNSHDKNFGFSARCIRDN